MLADLIIPILGATGALYLLGSWIWDACFSRLARIPNAHWSSPISPIWILYTRYCGTELEVLHEAHQRWGSVVRVGPRDLSVSCYNDGVRTIYGGGMDKPDYYDYFQYHGYYLGSPFSVARADIRVSIIRVNNAFSTKLRADHSVRRRRVAGLYTKSFIRNSPHLAAIIQTVIDGRLLPLMTKLAGKAEPFCMLRLSWALSFDIMTSFVFGLEVGTNLLADVSEIDKIAGCYDDRYPAEAFWKKEAPRIYNILAFCGWEPLGPRNKKYQHAREYLESWTLRMCEEANAMLDRPQQPAQESGAYPAVYAQMKKSIDEEYSQLDSKSKMTLIASELFDHFCE